METGRIGKTIESFVTMEQVESRIDQALERTGDKKSELPFEEEPVSLLSATPMLSSDFKTTKLPYEDLQPQFDHLANELRGQIDQLSNEKDESFIKLIVAGELGKIDEVLADIVSSIEKLSRAQTELETQLRMDPVANQLVIESIANAQAEILQENFDEIKNEFDSLRSETKHQQQPDIVPQLIEIEHDDVEISDSKLKSLTKRIKKLEKNKNTEIYAAMEEMGKLLRDDMNSRFALSARSQQQMGVEIKNANQDIGQLTTKIAENKRFLTDRIGRICLKFKSYRFQAMLSSSWGQNWTS